MQAVQRVAINKGELPRFNKGCLKLVLSVLTLFVALAALFSYKDRAEPATDTPWNNTIIVRSLTRLLTP